MLNVNDKAPEFELSDAQGKLHRLSDYAGSKTVVYFYPKDNTPGCTREACAFKGAFAEYEELGVKVIGISRDGQASHDKFIKKYDLPFILLSDPDRQAIDAFGVGAVLSASRSTFLIDENGFIEKVWAKAKPDTNAAEILEYIRSVSK